MRKLLYALSCLVILFAIGCNSNIVLTPTPRPPTLTPTPLSTPLPTVGTPVPLGSKERPYYVTLVSTDKTASGTKLEAALTKRTNAEFRVEFVGTIAEALSAICGEKPTFAWLDGRGLLAAQAQGCGSPALQVEDQHRGLGVRSELVALTGVKDAITAPAGFKGKDFCRINGQDEQGWILPSLALRAAGINPALDLKGIKEFATNGDLLQAVADGKCAGVGVPLGTLDALKSSLSGSGTLTVISTTPALPYGGLAASSAIPAAIAQSVAAELLANPDSLHALVKFDDLVPASAASLAAFEQFAQRAGLNLTTLGQ